MSGGSAVLFTGEAARTALVLAQRVRPYPHSRSGGMLSRTASLSGAASCLPERTLHCPLYPSTASTLLSRPLSRNAAARQPRRATGLCQAALTSDYSLGASVTSQAESQLWSPLGVLPSLADASAESSAGTAVPDPSTFIIPGTDDTTNVLVSALFVVAAIGLVTLTAGVLYLAYADWNDKREVEALQREAAQETRSKAREEPRTPRRDPPPGMKAAKGFGSSGASEQK